MGFTTKRARVMEDLDLPDLRARAEQTLSRVDTAATVVIVCAVALTLVAIFKLAGEFNGTA
jgi:hypothetical protein